MAGRPAVAAAAASTTHSLPVHSSRQRLQGGVLLLSSKQQSVLCAAVRESAVRLAQDQKTSILVQAH
jgi:hypothetical protein